MRLGLLSYSKFMDHEMKVRQHPHPHRMNLNLIHSFVLSYSETIPSMAMAAHLPQTLREFSQIFGNASIMKKIQSPGLLTPTQSAIWKYSGGALILGRPLNTVMIFMGGASGAGKSTTINELFEDTGLCSTSSSTSETKHPVRLLKELNVTRESPPVIGNLTFVDVPGAFDTDEKNEVENFASISKFRYSSHELQSREAVAKVIPNCPETVYPNVILFVVKATDDRIVGANSFFRKSLESFKLHDLFDEEHPNLIIVLSRARSLGGKPECFNENLKKITQNIRKVTQEVLGVTDVDVVPVENDGDGQDLDKRGDFYVLPNGELSHSNLFKAMLNIFIRNKDIMGRLFTGWYFGSSCPEKKTKVVVDTSEIELEDIDVALAGQVLQDLHIPVSADSIIPQYNFQSLGRGYCPVTEEVRPDFLLNKTGSPASLPMKTFKIENSTFLIPNLINERVQNRSIFQRISFYEKEEYQNHMKASYGIDAGFKLIVSASSEGRWISGGEGSHSSSLIKMVQERQVATFKLDNPREHVTNTNFLKDLRSLPNKYDHNTAREFRSFFSKWGTHLVYEGALGGAIQLNCTLQRTSLTKDKLQEIEGQVSAIFNGFSGSSHVETQTLAKGLKTVGVSNQHLEIDGGDPPPLITLKSVNSKQLRAWAQTISKKPVELRQSMKLYPYFNLLNNGPELESLREATREYMADALEARIQAAITRAEISEQVVTEAVQAPAPSGPPCFPKGTLVELWGGERKKIELLSPDDDSQMKTVSFNCNLMGKERWKLGKVSKTNFCTFLDLKSEEMVEYLVFHFSNGKNLIVSEAHMIFQYSPDGTKEGSKRVKAKQAKHFKIGEMAVYLATNSAGEEKIETPVIEDIRVEMHVGAYAPLTMAGTFFADGFLVSSYANTDSFLQAQMALLPLKMWCKMNRNNIKKKEDNGGNSEVRSVLQKEGIHPFAKFLMTLRKSVTSFGSSG
ncbi:unnamed protein product [Orchesella dallaii]|uniref:MACPF domain-containing protein n=1 Tax=Orchesella dallaii TaxID=48710 RepID=A0ABP1RYL5_9HEXA